MGKRVDHLDESLRGFIEAQKIFFVATVAPGAKINLSPKGMDSLRVVDERRVLWLNLTGSGNETATHLRTDDRMTLMWCAFEGSPRILRAYGHARVVHPRDADWDELVALLPAQAGTRQVFVLDIDLVQTSCGFGVPLYEFQGEREQLVRWADTQGPEGVKAYWAVKNQVSLDGEPTGIFEP